jgi:hypothetical protein
MKWSWNRDKKKKLFVNHDSRPAGHHVPSFTEMKNIYEIGATMCVMISSNGRCTHGRRVEPKRTLCSTAKVLSGAFRVVPLQLPTVVAFSPVPWKPRHASRRYFFFRESKQTLLAATVHFSFLRSTRKTYITRPCLLPLKNPNFFKILRYIEFLDTCMEY